MKFLIALCAVCVPSAHASYDCQLKNLTKDQWVETAQFSFGTQGSGQVYVDAIDLAGKYKLRAQEISGSTTSLEVIDRSSGLTVGGNTVQSGQPIGLIYSDFEVSCRSK